MKKLISIHLILFLVMMSVFPVFAEGDGAVPNLGGDDDSDHFHGQEGKPTTSFEAGLFSFGMREDSDTSTITAANKELQINVCNSDCSGYTSMKLGDYMKQKFGYTEAQVDNYLASGQFTAFTNLQQSEAAGAPVFYSVDKTIKDIDDFFASSDIEGSAEHNEKLKFYWDSLTEEQREAFRTGNQSLTAITLSKEQMEEFCKDNPNAPGCGEKNPCEEDPTLPECNYSREKPPIYRDNCRVGDKEFVYDGYREVSETAEVVPLSFYIAISPVVPQGLSNLPADQQTYWYTTHSNQASQPQMTAAGNVLNSASDLVKSMSLTTLTGEEDESAHIAAGSAGSGYSQRYDALRGMLDAASYSQTANITMNTQNLKGLARGGLFTITKFVKSLRLVTTEYEHRYDVYRCVRDSYLDPSSSPVYGPEGELLGYETTYTRIYYTEWEYRNEVSGGSYKTQQRLEMHGGNYVPVSSYQILAVRCNDEAFSSAVAATGSSIIENAGAVKVAKSPTITSGVSTAFNRYATIDMFYEGTSCDGDFDCTSQPIAGTSRDIGNNVVNTGNHNDDKFGAQAGEELSLSSSEFSIFRDNNVEQIRNDIWTLTEGTGNWIHAVRNPAIGTLLSFDVEGTPKGDMFAFENANETVLLTGSDLEAGRDTLLFPGEYNLFNWRASWASEKDNPQRLNIKYLYKPRTIANLPIAFSESGVTNTRRYSEVMDMYCHVMFDTASTVSPVIINQPKEEDYSNPPKYVSSEDITMDVNFVKSSAE